MAFQEAGTRILQDLGILDSNIQSPHRNHIPENENLPQVSSPAISKKKDESTQSLIGSDPIIPSNSSSSTQSDTLFKELTVYIFGLTAIFAAWLLIANISDVSRTLKINNAYQISYIPALFGAGTLVGSYLIIPFLLKVYALFTIQFFASFAVGVAILQYNSFDFTSLLFAMTFLGVAWGVIERFSYLYIHRVLQNSKQKVLFFYAVLAFGIIFANLVFWHSTAFNQESIISRAKRDPGLPATNVNISDLNFQATTEAYRPTKPSSAIGIVEDQNKKTAENAEKRRLAEIEKQKLALEANLLAYCKDNPNAENCTNTMISTTTEGATTIFMTTTIVPSTIVSTTEALKKAATSTKPPSFLNSVNNFFEDIGLPSESQMYKAENETSVIFVPRSRNRKTKFDAEDTTLSPKNSNATNSESDQSSNLSFVAGIIFVLILVPVNIAAFVCNHFWSKETLLTLSLEADTLKQPSMITRISSIVLWILSDFLTFGLFSLAPFIYASFFDKKVDEFPVSYGIFIAGLVFSLRIIVYIFSDFAVSKRCIQILLILCFCCSIIFFVLKKSDLSFIVFLGTGVCTSNISILVTLFQQNTVNLSSYTTSGRYMLWSSVGRISGPLIMGKILAEHSYQTLANLVFAIIIMMLIAFYYFSKNLSFSARHQQLHDLKMDISSPENNVNSSGVPGTVASTSSGTSTNKTRSTTNGTHYSLLDDGDIESLSNCLISDSEDDELLNINR